MSWKTLCWEAILLGFLFSCTGSDKDSADRKWQIDYDCLKSNFQQPDRTYGVNCWWWWLNGNVTKKSDHGRFGSDEIPELPGSYDL